MRYGSMSVYALILYALMLALCVCVSVICAMVVVSVYALILYALMLALCVCARLSDMRYDSMSVGYECLACAR
jgi:hypothetical protein